MKLVIAEKPSVAISLAAVLGANEKKDGYLEGGGYLVSWCMGHLLELAQPEAYGEQYARWSYGDLPILPDEWKYEVPKDKKKQLDLLCRLMKDKRVESVVCATDAGREGELIFRLVYEHAGCKKPMERLWISSMEDGTPKYVTWQPESEKELQTILRREHVKRDYHAKPGNIQEYMESLKKDTMRGKLEKAKTAAASTPKLPSHKKELER